MFIIHWIGTNGQRTGNSVEAEAATTYAEAIWEATKIMRSFTKDSTDSVNAGDYPVGFYVESP